MGRERVPDADGRTLAVALRSVASTATLERSCLLGALCSMVRILQCRMVTNIGGVVNRDQQTTDVKEERTGCMKKHQNSANDGGQQEWRGRERLTNLVLSVRGRDGSAKPTRRGRSFLRGKRAVVQTRHEGGQRLWRHGAGRRGRRAVAVRGVGRPGRGGRQLQMRRWGHSTFKYGRHGQDCAGRGKQIGLVWKAEARVRAAVRSGLGLGTVRRGRCNVL